MTLHLSRKYFEVAVSNLQEAILNKHNLYGLSLIFNNILNGQPSTVCTLIGWYINSISGKTHGASALKYNRQCFSAIILFYCPAFTFSSLAPNLDTPSLTSLT